MDRISWDEYFLRIAYAVSARSNCIRRHIGAVIVNEKIITSTGYNGTPMGIPNCFDGGCKRCNSDGPSGANLDECVCIHAEENAIVFAARHGSSTSGATLYTTNKPCLGCLKKSIQAGIRRVVYAEEYAYTKSVEKVYDWLVEESGIEMVELKLDEHPETVVDSVP
ncbi:MAG: dCMP deaminase family protein [Gemmatimonadetes bacterium]|nr:dCMP deaminase family protein [Gemmatimonadota bacterium]MYG84895.1 dCMP deaminase family protein [Gemmatimonadota bacterium]MYJ89084.1 dCMP deaminase family protein [Gemmatimonadota bacterium]